MSKNRNLIHNSEQNFIVRRFNSIQIGLYFLLGAYLIKNLSLNFILDSNSMGMMSVEIIEILCVLIVLLLVLCSSLAIFFSNRRVARKSGYRVWSKKSKKYAFIYFSVSIVGIITLSTMYNLGWIRLLTPFFLAYVGLLLLLLNTKKEPSFYLLISVGLLLALLVFFIPTYWYSAISILGISFVVYGIMAKK